RECSKKLSVTEQRQAAGSCKHRLIPSQDRKLRISGDMETLGRIAATPDALDFTVENVEKALHQLYYDPNIENKNLAQKWLMQAQISRYWSDIPTDQYESLKTQLFSQIACFSSGSKMVLTRLCVALASLALNTMPEAWPGAVAEMVRVFQEEGGGVDGRARCLALLELLTVLPEEFQTSRLPQYRKGQVRGALGREWGSVCPLLQQLLRRTDSPGAVKARVLRCLSSWVLLDVPLNESEGLVQDCFSALHDPELFDTAVEAIVNAISQPDSQRYVNTLLKLVPQVLALQEQLREAVQNGDMETCHGICRIAVTLGENHSRTLLEQVDHWQSFLALVNMIMFCTGIPGHYPDEIMSFESDKQAVYLQVYRPVYFQLVDVLLHKAQFPSDQEYASWSSDEKEQFRIYRVDISDTLMYVYEMLGAELLSNLYDKLGRLLTNAEQPTSWQHTEALLYGFQSIAETIDVNYSDVIPGLIGLIPRININNVQLADTVMFTIGALAEWLADHPVMLSSVLPLVLQALGNPDLSVSSVSTLKKICRECKYDLPPYATNIVAVSQEVLIKQIHKTSQCMWLMQALGFLLSALPVEEILRNLHSLITPYIQQLEKLADETPNPSNKLAIIHILGLLSNLFTTLDISKQDDESADSSTPPVKTAPPLPGPNPVVVVLQQVFALIQTVLSKWLNDSQVVEAVCAIFEKSVKTLLHDFAPMVSQLSEMLGQMYSTIPQASALDLTRQALFELVTSVTLSIFQQVCCWSPSNISLKPSKKTMFEKTSSPEAPSERKCVACCLTTPMPAVPRGQEVKGGGSFRFGASFPPNCNSNRGLFFFFSLLLPFFPSPNRPMSLSSACFLFLVGLFYQDSAKASYAPSPFSPSFLTHDPGIILILLIHLCNSKLRSGYQAERALKRKPDLFLSESLDVKAVFHCGVLSLKFPEAPTVKSTCLFFTELLPRCSDVPPVARVVQEDGKLLIQAVLEGIGGGASRCLMDQFAEVLFSLNKHCFSLLAVWLKEALQPPGYPSSRVTTEQKDNFSHQILRERVNKRRVKDIVKEFTLLCRGLHGTEYAAEY
ncbi:hypothetical protein FQN60_012650, partial [Etheostoma spectabile]